MASEAKNTKRQFYHIRLQKSEEDDQETKLSRLSFKTLWSGYLHTNSVHGVNPHIAKANGEHDVVTIIAPLITQLFSNYGAFICLSVTHYREHTNLS